MKLPNANITKPTNKMAMRIKNNKNNKLQVDRTDRQQILAELQSVLKKLGGII
jgi:hypothetical protein